MSGIDAIASEVSSYLEGIRKELLGIKQAKENETWDRAVERQMADDPTDTILRQRVLTGEGGGGAFGPRRPLD